jgi:hypothetical protein
MSVQVVYQTNADYLSTYEAMVRNALIVADITEKGLLWFKFKGSKPIFLLSPKGKLSVKWNCASEKRLLCKLLKNILIANDSDKIMLKPLRLHLWKVYSQGGQP